MATLTISENGTRVFRVPFGAPIPSVFADEGELVIETAGPEATPITVGLRLYPDAVTFQARLPAIANALGMPDAVFAWGRMAEAAQPVLEYAGGPAVVARVPMGLVDLAALARYTLDELPLFDLADYALEAIAFEVRR